MRDVIKSEDAARFLNMCVVTLRTHTATGKIPGVKIGGTWRYSRKALTALVMQKAGGTLVAQSSESEPARMS